MDMKNIKNVEYLKSSAAVKDNLENLCLFLNEIEKIINTPKTSQEEIGADRYKLKILEMYITEMNDVFQYISEEMKKEERTIL